MPSPHRHNAQNRVLEVLHRRQRDSASIKQNMELAKREVESKGYALLRLGPRRDKALIERASHIVGSLGEILRVFPGQTSDWTEIKSNPLHPENWTTGAGFFPLHMDFVSAERPPDLTCIFCIRPDPKGGGGSLVAPVDVNALNLTDTQKATLNQTVFYEHLQKDLVGLGSIMNLFPVLDLESPFPLRFTSRLLQAPQPDYKDALSSLAAQINRKVMGVSLCPGDLLIMNQRRVLHGRLPLGKGQEKLLPAERRLVALAFIRTPWVS